MFTHISTTVIIIITASTTYSIHFLNNIQKNDNDKDLVLLKRTFFDVAVVVVFHFQTYYVMMIYIILFIE